MTAEQLFQNEITYDAVLRNLMVIGEAAKCLPENIQNQFPTVEWKKISGFRDIIAHAYFGIDDMIVWDIVQTKIPPLLTALNSNQ